MAATPPKKTIVNLTLVRVDAGGTAGGSRTRSGKGLVKTDSFQVSTNFDARVPQRARLPRVAAGDDIAGGLPADAINATTLKGLQDPTPAKRRQEGPSTRKRKEVRAAYKAPPHAEVDAVDAAPNKDGDDEVSDANIATPEVSDDKGPGGEGDNSSTESAPPRSIPKPNTSAVANGSSRPADEDDGSTNDNEDDMEALRGLMRDPQLVCSVFARRVADK